MRSLVFTFVLFSIAAECYAQSSNPLPISNANAPGVTLSQVVASIEQQLLPGDTIEGGSKHRLKKFHNFWASRVSHNDSSGDNMFRQYYKSLYLDKQAKSTNGCNTSGFSGAWKSLGPDESPLQNLGLVSDVWVDPSDTNKLLVATYGGIFKSTNAGQTWACITDNQTSLTTGVFSPITLAINPANKNQIYAGIGTDQYPIHYQQGYIGPDMSYGGGIIYSLDGGQTWQPEIIQRGASPDWFDNVEFIQKLFFSPDGTKLFAFVHNEIFYKNYPSGTWTKIYTAIPTTDNYQNWFNVAFIPGSNTDFFVTSKEYFNSAYLKRFTYSGGSYTYINVPQVPNWGPAGFQLADVSPRTSNSMYIMLRDDQPAPDDRLYIYTYDPNDVNDPGSFQFVSNLPNFFGTFRGVDGCGIKSDINNPDVVYYNVEVPYISRDGGQNFVEIGTYWSNTGPTHADIRACYIQHSESSGTDNGIMDRVYFANDGGISIKPRGKSITQFGNATTKNINGKGLNIGHFTGLSVSEKGGEVFQGSFHFGFHAYEPGETQKWAHFPGGDGHNVVFNRRNPTLAYARDINTTMYVTANYTGTTRVMDNINGVWGLPTGGTNPEKKWVKTPLWPDQFGNVYVGLSNVWAVANTTNIPYQVSGQNVSANLPPNLQDIGLRSSDLTTSIPETHATDFSPYYDDHLVGYVAYGGSELYYRSPSLLVPNFQNMSIPIKQQTGDRPIADLALDPRQPDRVWVAIGGFNWWPDPTERVVYSPDGGAHWLDVSKGLPQRIPVTNIVFHEGANTLYASTDVGIYKLDMAGFSYSDINDDMSGYNSVEWKCFNKGAFGNPDFPQAFVTELEINYCQGRLYASTYGRATWYTNLLIDPYPANNPPTYADEYRPIPQEVITTNTTWSSDKIIYTGIKVTNGATLTIANTGNTQTVIHMPKNGVILVEKGSTLIVDGAKITNSCEECMWAGISVQGTAAAPQTLQYQGKLILKNGAVLEHARNAVGNSFIDDPNRYSNTGGIIQATNTTFQNNARAVEFLSYHAAGSYNDLSYFKDCRFTINDAYKGVAVNFPFECHVTLWDVYGVEFNGCTFVNNHTGSLKSKGTGIYGYNADFDVRPYLYTGGGSSPGNRFDSLKYGIVADGDMYGAPVSIVIDRNSFSANSIGIKIINLPNVSMIRNTFTVGNGSGIQEGLENACKDNIGIYTQNTQQFRIEENIFNGATGSIKLAQHSVGTLVYNSGENDKELYKNSYTDLDFGVYAQGKNRVPYVTTYPSGNTGLRVICNTFTKNTRDISVTGDLQKKEGIAYWQGYYIPAGSSGNIVGAGNRFMTSTATHIYNNASNFNYFHNNSVTLPTNITGPVTVMLANTANECASRLSTSTNPDGPVELLPDRKIAMKNLFWTSKSNRDNRQNDWLGLINDGRPEQEVLDEVSGLSALDAMTLLLSYSPYVSGGVIKGAASSGVIDKSMLKEVLAENPDVLRDMEVMAYLSSDEMPDPLDESDMDELESSMQTVTARTLLEAEISFHQANMSQAVNMLLTDIKCREEVTEADSIELWLNRTGELWAQYQKAYRMFGKGDYADVEELLTELIPGNYALSEDEATENQAIFDIITILKDRKEEDRYFAPLNTEEESDLDKIRDAELPAASSLAVSILGKWGNITIPCIDVPNNPTSRPAGQKTTASKKKANLLNVYPNPASDYIVFEYQLQDNKDAIHITVSNILGQQVGSFELKAKATGKYYWDVRHLPAGTYSYKANSIKKDYGSGKITIAR